MRPQAVYGQIFLPICKTNKDSSVMNNRWHYESLHMRPQAVYVQIFILMTNRLHLSLHMRPQAVYGQIFLPIGKTNKDSRDMTNRRQYERLHMRPQAVYGQMAKTNKDSIVTNDFDLTV